MNFMGEYHAEMGAYLFRYIIGRWSIWVHGNFSGSRAHCAHPVFCLLRRVRYISCARPIGGVTI
jgi:hypothetical protein